MMLAIIFTILLLVFFSDEFPIRYAIRTKGKTTILHAILWALAAWSCWMYVCLADVAKVTEPLLLRYMALGLTGCASIAVLGARRPGVAAWNFVILGLLVVMIFLWLEGQWAADDVILGRVRTVLLASTIGIGVLNYLPTRLAPAAILLGLACGLELLLMAGSIVTRFKAAQTLTGFILALVPWTAYARMRWRPLVRSEFDQVWLDFRDLFGLVWAQRLREQFNASAAHENWPVVLRWQGLRLIPGRPLPSPIEREEMIANLRALMKRFQT